MAGYAVVWIFVVFFALVFLLMTTAYYTGRFLSFLRKYWSGE